jgi:hypothetical protein
VSNDVQLFPVNTSGRILCGGFNNSRIKRAAFPSTNEIVVVQKR